MIAGNVDKFLVGRVVKMVVMAGIGVEIGTLGIDHDLTQQASFGELMQGVVDRRQRHADARFYRFAMQNFRRDMPITGAIKQTRQVTPLACWPKPCGAQVVAQVVECLMAIHGRNIGTFFGITIEKAQVVTADTAFYGTYCPSFRRSMSSLTVGTKPFEYQVSLAKRNALWPANISWVSISSEWLMVWSVFWMQ